MSRMNTGIDRRRLLQGSAGLGLLGLSGCATATGVSGPLSPSLRLAPVRARADRLFDITVCLRPFRAAGPRLDTEMVGDTLVVHNYGHGGSGWSLSWGSGTIAVGKAMANSPAEVAVIGCGALGLTSAILAQQAGAKVTIYAQDLMPQTRSARATGSWTPSSRIALEPVAGRAFEAVWEQMARTSHKTFRSYLGLAGKPVEWVDRYNVTDLSREEQRSRRAPNTMGFAEYDHLLSDLGPAPQLLERGSTPFDVPYVYRSESMMFNLAHYGHTLMRDFFAAGGQFKPMTFNSPAQIGALKEKVVINCTGYGARALWKDETLVPVRGQIGWLIPQAEVNYGLTYKSVSVLSRTDGIVIQAVDGGDMKGYNDASEAIDRAESVRSVGLVAELYGQRFRA